MTFQQYKNNFKIKFIGGCTKFSGLKNNLLLELPIMFLSINPKTKPVMLKIMVMIPEDQLQVVT